MNVARVVAFNKLIHFVLCHVSRLRFSLSLPFLIFVDHLRDFSFFLVLLDLGLFGYHSLLRFLEVNFWCVAVMLERVQYAENAFVPFKLRKFFDEVDIV